MSARFFQHYVLDPLLRKRLEEYLDLKRARGLTITVTERPCKGVGVHPVAVVKIGGSVTRLFYSPDVLWKVRWRTAIYVYEVVRGACKHLTQQEVAEGLAAPRAGPRPRPSQRAYPGQPAEHQERPARQHANANDLDREIEQAAALLLRPWKG